MVNKVLTILGNKRTNKDILVFKNLIGIPSTSIESDLTAYRALITSSNTQLKKKELLLLETTPSYKTHKSLGLYNNYNSKDLHVFVQITLQFYIIKS